MKHFLKTVACVVALVSAAAHCQAATVYGYTTTNMTLAYTSVAASSTSNVLTGVLSTRAGQEVGVSFGVLLSNTNAAGGSTSITLNFGTSPYATSNFNNNAATLLPVVAAANGTSIVWCSTNLAVGSLGYVGLISTVNGNTNATAIITNLTYTYKDRRFGPHF